MCDIKRVDNSLKGGFIMKKYKKIITLGLIIGALLVPIFKVNYYNGENIEMRRYSAIGMAIQDIKDGTLGTKIN